MRLSNRPLVGAVVAGLLLLAAHARAADPVPTTITIPDMDCASCAKKIGGKVAEVPGVAKVEYDVQARFIRVTPKTGTTLSPKALWEAAEKGGKDLSKLDGPSGTFTKKPTN
ncbi:MAG: heavy metal transporter [Isosphaera sp.]|nr:heavy metal transporter [Isosphaera sp.]